MRVNELAKELGKTPREVIDMLEKSGIKNKKDTFILNLVFFTSSSAILAFDVSAFFSPARLAP